MLVLRFVNFLTGSVSILVHHGAPEKFINMASSRGIFIWAIRMPEENKVLLQVRLSAVKPLRHIARKTGCRFEIVDREGLPFLLARLSRRKTLVTGILFFLLAIYFLGSFIWFVEVSGNHLVPQCDIIKAAAKAGLARGRPAWKLNVEAVEKSLQEQFPAISWVGVYIKGTRADIEIVEKTLPAEKENGLSHIVAAKTGLVKDVLVLKGHPVVKEGDTVVSGQVLITGIVPPPEAAQPGEEPAKGGVQKEVKQVREPAYVEARGIVRARVWYEEYSEAQLREQQRKYTGRIATKICMKIGEKKIILKGPPKAPFTFYEEESFAKKILAGRNLTPGVELITVKYREWRDYLVIRSKEQAFFLAKEKALASIKQKLPKDAIILKERVEELVAGQPENVARARVYVETLEDIGVRKAYSVK